MNESGFNKRLFLKYLKLLGLRKQNPDTEYLRKIVHAHISNVPFENLSKLFYKKRINLNGLIDFELYLEGIEKYHFGGTCYANNFYFNQLLNWLGFEVKLCGADMKEPNVHLVNIVKLENQEFLIDTGYAAPFFEPLPLGLLNDYVINSGSDRYVLKAQINSKRPEIELYRNGFLKHGYKVNTAARKISDFEQVIEDSFKEDSTFMQSLLITRFKVKESRIIHNMTWIEMNELVSKTHAFSSINQIASFIDQHFGIPEAIVLESIQDLQMKKDSWN